MSNKKNKKKNDKLIFIKKAICFIIYIAIILLVYFTFSKNYLKLNFLQQFLGGPLIWIYIKLYSWGPALAFFISFLCGTILFFPLVKKSFISMLNFGKEFKNIMSVHNDTTLDSEQRVNKMIDIMEEKDASLFAPFVSIFYSFIWTFTTSGIITLLIEHDKIPFLWFDLLDKDPYFILPSLILIVMIPRIITNVKSLFKYQNKMKIFLDISLLIAKITLVIGCFTSALTSMITIIMIIYFITATIIKKYSERLK